MTRFAKPLLLETPCCQEKVKKRRFASVNTFGLASRWSDGFTSVPMVFEASRLAYCAACNKTYWLEDATELGMVPSCDTKSPHRGGWLARIFSTRATASSEEKAAPVDLFDLDFVAYHDAPRPADLLLAVLRNEWSNPEREVYLRTTLWWMGNHRQRGRRSASPMTDEQANENMLRLLKLHQTAPLSDQTREAIAELLRQGRRFDEAIAALEGRCAGNAKATAIIAAAARGESHVFEVETF